MSLQKFKNMLYLFMILSVYQIFKNKYSWASAIQKIISPTPSQQDEILATPLM